MGATVQKEGKWYILALHQRGKRKRWWFRDRRVAGLKAKEYDFRLAMEGWGFWEKPASETFGAYAEQQMALWEQGTLKPSTVEGWRDNLDRYLLPAFKDRPLQEISRAELKSFFAGLVKKGLRRYTILNVLAVLRRILGEAVEEGRLAANPAAKLGRQVLPRGEQPFEGKAYIPDQAKHLLKACEEKWPDRYPLFLCLLQTGLRLSEALALEWSDIDLSVGALTVRGTIFKGKKHIPKNGRIHRIKMTPALRACLETLYLKRQMKASNKGWKALPSWVFLSTHRTPLDRHNVYRNWWLPLLEAAELPRIRLHDLRGTVVSLLLNEGLTPWEVQAYIGHRSLVMTCNTYGHRFPGSERVEKALSKIIPGDATG